MKRSPTPGDARKAGVYRRAAKLIETRAFDRTCLAIEAARGRESDKASYRALYGFKTHIEGKLDQFTDAIYQACGHERPYPINSEETFDMRVLLLCFAAAEAERP